MMSPAIAIVGMACQYPDARSPLELWENVLAQRRAFRRMPTERLSLADYWSDNRNLPDATYGTEAALIEGYEFDRVSFRVTGNAFRSADFAHWLALDIATQALEDAGFPKGEGLPNEQTGVLLGNTLTGEFSRTNTLRLRWPYVRRVLEATLAEESDCLPEQRSAFFKKLEATYKAPFPEVSEETLAGNLSNTIAGRICNHYDLKGGGYTLDGACSSSLLAVAQASTALAMGDLDVALAGGVDLSLDPFELVGFAKAGALANGEMRVYDARSAGFLPGEGCGFVVLMRQEDALAQQRPIYAVIRGWGISSDGNGGITRPDIEGQLIALRRAYKRAGFGAETVSYFEGHGTGTAVGDTTELQVLARARQNKSVDHPPAALGSIKANIGHTKAAAGLAGLIKAVMALRNQVLPPTTGCEQPHPELRADNPAVRVLREAEPWPGETPLRASVSAMGFGGINTHVVMENPTGERRQGLTPHERSLSSSSQDCELFLLGAETTTDLRSQVDHLLTIAPRLSRSELTDLAAELERSLKSHPVRAAIAAATPEEFTHNLETLRFWIESGVESQLDSEAGVFLGKGQVPARVGFLFPGQASPSYLQAGAWGHRFSMVQALYDWADLPQDGDRSSTEIAQPAIMTSTMAGLRVLGQLGIQADVGLGHSLGELAALHWAGSWDEETLLRVAKVRGQAMARLGSATGAMASLQADAGAAKALINGECAVVAGLNSPLQTIISGEAADIETIVGRAQGKGLKAVTLPVSHAFHSPLVAAAVQPLEEHLAHEAFQALQRSVVSTVSGQRLSATEDLRSLLCRQVTDPVRFMDAIEQASQDIDLFIEVGPGGILSRLASDCVDVPVVSLDAGSPSLRGLLHTVGAAHAVGVAFDPAALFRDRFTRPFSLDWQPRFFVNPCELAPRLDSDSDGLSGVNPRSCDLVSGTPIENGAQVSEPLVLEEDERTTDLPESAEPIEVVRHLVAAKTELPLAAIQDENRLLSDLHLNSITVSQIVVDASRQLGLAPPVSPTHYADATVAEVAQALEELIELGGTANPEVEIGPPAGVDAWVRAFTVEQVENVLSPRRTVLTEVVDTSWQVFAPSDYLLQERLQVGLQNCPGPGVAVCLPPEGAAGSERESLIELLLAGAHAALAEPKAERFVLVQHGRSCASVAKTLFMEAPEVNVCVVSVPMEHPQAVDWILAEAQAVVGFSEARYDEQGKRYEPRLQLLESSEETELSLTAEDVLLVTGGGKGIAAECAISLARETGVRLAILGRSQPDADEVLATNLERMVATGVQVQYVAADVTDAVAVRQAVTQFESELGPVTAVLHGAGVNSPKLLGSLTLDAFQKTMAPKLEGIENLAAALNSEQLKLLVTFGSIIAHIGLPGEADYGLANEWLAQWVDEFQKQHIGCRCLNIEWSIWSGVGMGERLGRLDILTQQGITAITPDIGVEIIQRLLSQRVKQMSVVVTGRFGEPPTLKMEKPTLPFVRFLEQPRVYYPGVELVVDVDLSVESDLYLDDHNFKGERIFPAVMGLEAMAQVAMALAETSEIPVFENLLFQTAVVVTDEKILKVRIAAQIKNKCEIHLVLRSAKTVFLTNHMEGDARFGCKDIHREKESLKEFSSIETIQSTLSLNPEIDIYGKILFHGKRFHRLNRYMLLNATECIAETKPAEHNIHWFSQYLPNKLVLGDPASRDAVIHALQACIPHGKILPFAVDKVITYDVEAEIYIIHGKQRSADKNIFVYDIKVFDHKGALIEAWEGLKVKVLSLEGLCQPCPADLLGPYVEQKFHNIFHDLRISVSLFPKALIKDNIKNNKLHQYHQLRKQITKRPDNKPLYQNCQDTISISHVDDLTLIVSGEPRLSCDIERSDICSLNLIRDLIGYEQYKLAEFISNKTGKNPSLEAIRIWAAQECLKKVGVPLNLPLSVDYTFDEDWIFLTSSNILIATFSTIINISNTELFFAILLNTNRMSNVFSRT